MINQSKEVQTYRALDALNYSMLADWKGCPGNLTVEKKVTAAMELGTAGHLLLQDTVMDNGAFHDLYFIMEEAGEMPTEVIEALKTGADMSEMYVYTLKNDLSKTYKNRHKYLDACIQNPGKMPISGDNYAAISAGIENLLKTEFMNLPMSEYFKNAQWEKPFSWNAGTVKKKALFDIVCEADIGGVPYRFVFDPKFTNSFKTFEAMFVDRYWIQAQHYAEGMVEYTRSLGNKEKTLGMIVFLAIQVTEPFWCRPYIVEPDVYDDMRDDYLKLCYDFSAWVDDGRPQLGFMPTKSLRWWRI